MPDLPRPKHIGATIISVAPRFVILNPCPKRWTDLTATNPTARTRFCPDCQTQIHDLNRYSPQELADLRRASPGRLCGYLAREQSYITPPRSRRAMLLAAFLTAISPLIAQSGKVRIRVMDPSGARIPAAEISLLGDGPDRDGKTLQIVSTDAIGEAVITGLPMGDSSVRMIKPGFRNLMLLITVKNGEEQQIDATMEVNQGIMGVFVELKFPLDPVPIDSAPRDLPPNSSRTSTAIPPPIPPKATPKKKHKRWWPF